jgi:hypothetical protein
MQHLRAPQRDDDVSLARPARDAEPIAERLRQERALVVVRAGHVLEVREAGAILDVQQGAALEVPGDDIGPSRELVVLIRLVDAGWDAQAAEVRSLELAHRRVHRVD